MIVLGIETSCDDTSVALVSEQKNIISNIISSQIELHQEFGGVVPELAARSHLEVLDVIIKKALVESALTFEDIDAVAVTAGPGLIGSVIIGLMAGKAISSVFHKPFIAVNHLEGHALTIRLTENIEFPYLLLLVSGGHCQLLMVNGVGLYQKLGETIDDALGEAFDKIAQMLGLGYPGGPAIEEAAKKGDPYKFSFPKPLTNREHLEHKLNFSFSGLKTAVRREIEKLSGSNYQHSFSHLELNSKQISDIAASFQRTAAEIIIDRLNNALKFLKIKPNKLVIAGGVAANRYLYSQISDFMKQYQITTLAPPIKLCTDNGAMIAWAGIEKLRLGFSDSLNFKPQARWELSSLP